MVIVDGKIIEATVKELYVYWLERYEDVIDFYTYKNRCEENGTKIVPIIEESELKDEEKEVLKRVFVKYFDMGINEIKNESPLYESIIRKLGLEE